jgi:ketosteroid isomerase-like protein
MANVEGIDAVGAMYQQMFATGNPTEVSLDPESIVVSQAGDLAYEVGTYRWTWPGPDGTPVTESSKYVSILRPTAAGEWEVAIDIWNQDTTPGPPIEMAPPPDE